MEQKNRKSGIEIMGDISWGTHICQFYQAKDDLLDILVPYFKAGLENNEFCMWVTSEPLGIKEAKASLSKAVRNLDDYIAKGQIDIIDYSEWYTKSGIFNADEVLQGWFEKENQALERGFDGLRLTGNTFWLERKDWKDFTECEAMVDRVIGNYRMLAICSYSLDRCGASEVVDVVSNYAFSLIRRGGKWIIIQSSECQRIKEDLSIADDRFWKAFYANPDMMVIFALKDERIIEFNASFLSATGYRREELIDRILTELDIWSKPKEYARHLQMLQKEKKVRYEEMEFRTKTGEIRMAVGSAEMISVGNELCVLFALQDITERKQMEEELRESEDRYRAIVDLGGKVGEAIVVRVDTDQGEGIMTFASDEWCRITGYSKGELLGMSFFDLVHPKYREASRGRYRKKMGGGEIVPGLFELGIIRKDGIEVPVELTSSHITYLGKDANVAFIRDITERKRAEESLEISEINLRSIIDSNIDGMVIVDEQGVIRFVNPAAESLFGRKSAELVGSIFGFTLVEGESSEIEVIRPDKTRLVIEARMGITEWEGAIIDLVSLRDITERKKMQEELIVSDRLASIGELVSGVAHEINNPLTGVIGFSGLLLDKKDLPDDIKEDLITISSEAKRAAQIAKNLVAFAGKHPTESEAVNIHKLIENTLSSRAHQHMLNNIEVNTKFASDLPEVVINSSKLQQVFMNIIINAEFFMIEAHKKGTLTIATECVGPIVKVSFADDGPGISPENLGHLFDPFFTTKEIGKGTGLGLSICFGIISEAGGRIYAESQLGKGATFVVALPAATPRIGGTRDENS